MSILEEDPLFEQLARKIIPRGRLLRAWSMKGGISASMTALEIEDESGGWRKVIVRQPGEQSLVQNPHAAQDEFRVLQIVHSLGLAAPRPLLVDDSGVILPTPYLVLEYVEGEVEFAPVDADVLVRQMAGQLANIHRNGCAGTDLSFLPRKIAEFARNSNKIPANLDPPFQEQRIREVLGAVWPYPQPNMPVLLHGDFWPGNLLWREGRLAAVLDWEDACLGDPLSDLAISRLDILWIFGVDAFSSFTSAYKALMPIDHSSLPYWDLDAALRLARLAGPDLGGWVDFFKPYRRGDITEDALLNHYQYFIAQALDQLTRLA